MKGILFGLNPKTSAQLEQLIWTTLWLAQPFSTGLTQVSAVLSYENFTEGQGSEYGSGYI